MADQTGRKTSVLMVGIGGYGYYYTLTLLNEISSDEADLVGVVDPMAEKSPIFEKIKEMKVPVFDEIDQFYAAGHKADLVVISSPIQYHFPQTKTALENGSHVLLDKPIGATVQEVDELIRIRDLHKRWVMVGYQWSYSQAIQDLKSDIMNGVLGKPMRLKSFCLWPRKDDYYQRNNWAGKMKDAQGRWVLDSPVNNALAHFVHNMFYVLGAEKGRSAVPAKVQAECYRANPIENYDTGIFRATTTEGTEILFYGAHGIYNKIGPKFRFEFEKGFVTYGEFDENLTAYFKDGSRKSYGDPNADHQFLKLMKAVKAVQEEDPEIVCGLEAARSQTLCMNGVQESVGSVVPFPEEIIIRDEVDQRYWAQNVDYNLCECYRLNALPSELKFPWAKAGEVFDLKNYDHFPSK